MEHFIDNLVQPEDLSILLGLRPGMLLRGWQGRKKFRDPGTKLFDAADVTTRFILSFCIHIGTWVPFTKEDLAVYVDQHKKDDMPDPRKPGTRPISVLDFLSRWGFVVKEKDAKYHLATEAINFCHEQAEELRKKDDK